jgi:uncharacterized membrane protein
VKILSGVLAAAYPFLVLAGLHWLEPRFLAVLLGLAVAARAVARCRRPSVEELGRLLAPALLLSGVLAVTLASNDPRFLMFVPALVSLALLVVFARSLVNGPPMIEAFARMQHSDFTAAELRHCRNVTWIWCVFFAFNAAVAFGLAMRSELWWWTLYTGGVAYVLMGCLFAGEFVYRAWRFRRYQGSVVEPLFRWVFPEDPTA